jgi:hypothetical protein
MVDHTEKRAVGAFGKHGLPTAEDTSACAAGVIDSAAHMTRAQNRLAHFGREDFRRGREDRAILAPRRLPWMVPMEFRRAG